MPMLTCCIESRPDLTYTLRTVAAELESGLVDADLGGHVYKKRVSLSGRGKRGGARTLIALRLGEKAFFL